MRSGMHFMITAVALASVLLAGCERISTEYGLTRGSSGRKSLNGFGALRTSFERAGFRSRDVSRLSQRVMRTDVIVWTPQVFGPVDTHVTSWFEQWLGLGNHTLVYIIPDSGSEADYWIETSHSAPPEQRLEYRKRAAKSIGERLTWRVNRVDVQSNGWFRTEPLVHRKKLGAIGGPWTQDLPEISQQEVEVSAEFVVAPFDADKDKAIVKATQAAGFSSVRPTGPGNPPVWMFPAEIITTKTPVDFSSLVTSETGGAIVAEIRSEGWKNSRIIVVAGGSLLTNYAFTRTFNRRLAAKVVTESKPSGDQDLSAGFLTSSWQQVSVSEKGAGTPAASGMELLTTWPMSLVTMHGVMLGLVICLMLMPIFGRPRKIQRSRLSHFGDHLDAVAALMNKAGGEGYARARISEYMKRMHGETSGPWVLPDTPTHPMAASPSLTSQRRMSRRVRPVTDASNTEVQVVHPPAPAPASIETSVVQTAPEPAADATKKSEHDEAER